MNALKLINRFKQAFQPSSQANSEIIEGPKRVKKALAIIVYDNYQEIIQLRNVLNLHIRNGGLPFDIGIFQDGLGDANQATVDAYNATAAESLKLVNKERFIRQDQHFGALSHRNLVEKFLYENLGYDVVLVLDSIDIPAHFFDELSKLADRFASNPKVASLTLVPSQQSPSLSASEAMNPIAYSRQSWLKTKDLMDVYTALVNTPMEDYQRNVLLSWWFHSLGFTLENTTRTALLNAVHAGLGMAEVSVPSDEAASYLTDADFEQLCQRQVALSFSDPQNFDRQSFQDRIRKGDVHVDVSALVPIDKTSVFDLFSAYKFFLRRAPENFSVVQARVGAPIELLFKDFLMSGEFLSHEVYWPAILEAAKKVIELSKAKDQAIAAQASASEAPAAEAQSSL